MRESFGFLVLAFLVAACQGKAPVISVYQTIYLLPDGRYEFDGDTADLATTMKRLSNPTSARLNIAACSASQSAKALQTVRALQAAGYEQIGFITTDFKHHPACGR